MPRDTFILLLADLPVTYRFLYPETAEKYRFFITEEAAGQPDAETKEEDFSIWEASYREEAGRTEAEFRIMVLILSEYMLSHRRCVCHAVAVRWKGLVWLFSAWSGTGKTTLYRNWKKYLGDEAEILSRDMPFLECRDDGSVRVHVSPWNGKEGYHGEGSGKLGGILFLKQGQENRMEHMMSREAILPVFRMILVPLRSPETAHLTALMTERILKSRIPIWSFENTGDLRSAQASTAAIAAYMNGRHDSLQS